MTSATAVLSDGVVTVNAEDLVHVATGVCESSELVGPVRLADLRPSITEARKYGPDEILRVFALRVRETADGAEPSRKSARN